MKRRYINTILLLLTAGAALLSTSCRDKNQSLNQKENDYCSYVNPFIGNADNGHTFPGACVPFGLIQASPESGNGSWRYCSGFNFDDDSIVGFSQTHLNGTGVPDLGDIRLFPFGGDQSLKEYKSRYDKKSQTAYPGYYAVHLTDAGVKAELSATRRTAYHKYTYENGNKASLLVDLQNGLTGSTEAIKHRVIEAQSYFPDNRTITGHNEVTGWVRRHLYYAIQFDTPYEIEKELEASPAEKAKKLILRFDPDNNIVQVKIGISTVSIDGALLALNSENPGWDIEQVKASAKKQWNDLLSRADITGSDKQKTNFYTSLYHLFIQPNNIADIDGHYRGVDDNIHQSTTKEYYSTFSLWDTYRAAHPLYTLLTPEKVDGFISTMLSHHQVQGYLPIWTLWGKENYCMIGNHAIPVIVDAYLKGFKGFNAEEAYRAIRETSLNSHKDSDWETLEKYGYLPYDIITKQSVSKTLECAYDDYCVALMAKAMGKTEDYNYFMKRSAAYKKLFDPETKLMRGRDSKGNWRSPFHPFALSHADTHGGDYTEGNAWQYTWHVQQDVEGLIELMGGKETFAKQLDSLFYLESDEKVNVLDVTGLIGQYAHGNEPSHHVAYLYNYVGKSYKTQELIREIFDRFYLAQPDGLCGNDDCGQMSAWYVFSAMGFYPVDPVSGEYIIGAPQIEHVSFQLPGGKKFEMDALGLSDENKYVESVTFNGKKVENFRIRHSDIVEGGKLIFTMTNNP